MTARNHSNKPKTGVNWIHTDNEANKKLNAKKMLEIAHKAEAEHPLHYVRIDSRTVIGKHL